MDLRERIRTFPEGPGVYLMKDSGGNIIYVGKSKNLRKRVSQYFSDKKQEWSKLVKLVQGIRDIEYIITDTEFDALLLECKLIGEIKPMYNALMKNPLGYSYIMVTVNEELPRLIATENKFDGKAIYFGPFAKLRSIERGVKALNDYFGLRTCSNESLKANTSGCLSYQLGQCLAPCIEGRDKAIYKNVVAEAISFLRGTGDEIIPSLENEMREASEKMDFLRAAKLRDDIFALKRIANREGVIQLSKKLRRLIAIEPMDKNNLKLFLISDGKVVFTNIYNSDDMGYGDIKNQISNSVKEFFAELDSTGMDVGKENIDQIQIIYSYLRNNKNNCEYNDVPEEYLSPYNTLLIEEIINNFYCFKHKTTP